MEEILDNWLRIIHEWKEQYDEYDRDCRTLDLYFYQVKELEEIIHRYRSLCD